MIFRQIYTRCIDYRGVHILWKCQDWRSCKKGENCFRILKQWKFVDEIRKSDPESQKSTRSLLTHFCSLTNFYCFIIHRWISPSKRGFSAQLYARCIDYRGVHILWKCQDWRSCRKGENCSRILKQWKFVNEQKWLRMSKLDEVPFNSLLLINKFLLFYYS